MGRSVNGLLICRILLVANALAQPAEEEKRNRASRRLEEDDEDDEEEKRKEGRKQG